MNYLLIFCCSQRDEQVSLHELLCIDTAKGKLLSAVLDCAFAE